MPALSREEFLSRDPESLSAPLRALWHEARGNWQEAHETAQAGDDRESASVHAYLHRREGDQSNAEYWYRRAGRPVYRGSLNEEWAAMVQEFTGVQML